MNYGLAAGVFAAALVESVEALTIVLAVGATRSWSSALGGAGAAILALAVLVLLTGRALAEVPVNALRIALGAVLLVYGAQWLRKAVLRAAGRKELHDEQAIFDSTARAAGAAERGPHRWDGSAFAIAAQGVGIEGLEVIAIVIAAGEGQQRLGTAATAAGLAILTVALAGFAVRRPLTRVPENALKMAVAVLLVTFGIFWLGEAAGIAWPAGDASVIALAALVTLGALATVQRLRRAPAAWPLRVAYDQDAAGSSRLLHQLGEE